MRKIKIVTDSSANVLEMDDIAFSSAPLKIIADNKEFVDDEEIDVEGMVNWFDSYKGKSKTSCPNPTDWLDAFGDADEVYCVTITSGLSGSHNAACVAKQKYEEKNIGKKVCVIDSLSTGPEMVLIIEKLNEYINQGLPYEEICQKIEAYKEHTGIIFVLESFKNLAANGRVSPAVAKIAGFLGIRMVCKASDQGTIEPTNKCRGEAKAINTILNNMKSAGLSKGKVHIAHCLNENAAKTLKILINNELPNVTVSIHSCRGLCSYYAEKGGMLVGFEKM